MATAVAAHKKSETTPEIPRKRSLVSLCKAAADPLRLDILRVLSKDSFGVQELAGIFSVPQPGMSHHLKILFQGGLVVTRRQGNSIFYRRTLLKGEGGLDAFQTVLYQTIDASAINDEYVRKIAAVYKERSHRSRIYFEKNVDRFEENQGMLCEVSQYISNLKELLDLMELPKNSRAMEVGPGQGILLEELTKRFGKLVALDDSAEMLDFTKAKVTGKSAKIEFVNSSLEAYSAGTLTFDAVVLNMVMHHMSSPSRAFQKLGQIVSAKGYLLIADLCSHNQEWARESCGDVWLGFDPQDLSDWAKQTGFKEEQSSYLGLKNGFQIQLKLFSKV